MQRAIQHSRQLGGAELGVSTRRFFEPRFARDFSRVRIHTAARAAEAARQVGARAFTVGNDIFFRHGEFAPETSDGRRLLAHELSHVVQQGRADRRGSAGVLRRQTEQKERPLAAEGNAVDECSEFGPAAREVDEDAPGTGLPPLVFRSSSTKRGRRPSVGHAQKLLNRYLALLATGRVGCGSGSNPQRIAGRIAQIENGRLVVDCRFGGQTELATLVFQECESLRKVDGLIGPETWRALEARTRDLPDPPPGPIKPRPSAPKPDPRSPKPETPDPPKPDGTKEHRFRTLAVTYLSCAPCNPFSDDGALATSPPQAEPAKGSSYRMIHFVDVRLVTRDGIDVQSAQVVEQGEDVGLTDYCGKKAKGHIVQSEPARLLFTRRNGIEGIRLERTLHARVDATVPPTLAHPVAKGAPCGALGRNPKVPFIATKFRSELFANGQKASRFLESSPFPFHYLYDDKKLKTLNGKPVSPPADYEAWATSTGESLDNVQVGLNALRVACCEGGGGAKSFSSVCDAICAGGFTEPAGRAAAAGCALGALNFLTRDCRKACGKMGGDSCQSKRSGNP